MRTVGYGLGAVLNLLGAVVLLRHLSVEQFGQYAAVTSLVAVAGGLADAGLTAVGSRELALLDTLAARRAMLRQLVGLRLVITPTAVVLAVLFAVVAGYPPVLVSGTALVGVGWIFLAVSSAVAMPLSVDLRITAVTVLDLVKQGVAALGIFVLVLVGAGLLPFFLITVPAGAIALGLSLALIPRDLRAVPALRISEWSQLLRRSLSMAFATVVGAVYLKVLTVMLFSLSGDVQTGLFGTSTRVMEAISGLPLLVFLVALPVMTASYRRRPAEMQSLLQNMVEVGTVLSWLLVTVLVSGAPVLIRVLGGEAYAGAVTVLRVQSLALIGSLLAMALLMGAIAMSHDRAILAANSIALGTLVVVGVPAVMALGATGAALATVVGDAAMAGAYLVMLRRGPDRATVSLSHMWKSAGAAAVALTLAWVLPVADLWRCVVAGVVFAAIVVLTRAVPGQVFEAFRRPAV